MGRRLDLLEPRPHAQLAQDKGTPMVPIVDGQVLGVPTGQVAQVFDPIAQNFHATPQSVDSHPQQGTATPCPTGCQSSHSPCSSM